MTTTAPETTEITVAQAAKAIADEIRAKGHYQCTSKLVSADARCIVLNGVYPMLTRPVATQLLEEIYDRAKMTSAYPTHRVCSLRAKAVIWNDNATTAQVLEVLDGIAAGGGA